MTASTGTIIHGTLRNEDLVRAFADELERLDTEGEHRNLIRDARHVDDPDAEEAHDISEDLQDALGEFAPPCCYFGTREGDGSDYGFWFSSGAFEAACVDGDVLKVSDLSEIPTVLPDGTEYIAHVNDHGNVTLYAPRIELTEIWGVV